MASTIDSVILDPPITELSVVNMAAPRVMMPMMVVLVALIASTMR